MNCNYLPNRKNSWASNNVICSANSTDLKLNKLVGFWEKLRPEVSRSGNNLNFRSSNFWMNLVRRARAKVNSPSLTSSAIKSVKSSITWGSWKSQSASPSTTRTYIVKENFISVSGIEKKSSNCNTEFLIQIRALLWVSIFLFPELKNSSNWTPGNSPITVKI